MPVTRTLLVSGDRDLLPEEVPNLKKHFGAIAGDWESGAIAFVAARNGIRILILKGVTDLVGTTGSQAYGNLGYYEQATATIMKRLVSALPAWIRLAQTPESN
jgi:adenosylhomocysteine nucleosidase